jgi:hypothetical protein
MTFSRLATTSVSLFSPRLFLAQTRHGISEASGIQTVSVQHPTEAIIFVRDEDASVWREGVAKTSAQTSHFTEQIAAGQIPTPLFPPLTTTSQGSVEYHAPQKLLGSAVTVLDALQLMSPLVASALASDETTCPQCFTPISLFSSPQALLLRAADEWQNESVSLDLIGPPTQIEAWATPRGFSFSPITTHQGKARIESLVASREKLASLADLLHSILAHKEAALVAEGSGRRAIYALRGACSQCGTIAQGATQAELTRILEQGAALPTDLLNRRIGTTTLGTIATSPLAKLQELGLVVNRVRPELLSILCSLGLGALTLSSRLEDLSSSAITILAILEPWLHPTTGEPLRILDIPRGIFSEDQLQQHLQLTGTTGTTVVLSTAPDDQLATPACILHGDTQDPLNMPLPRGKGVAISVPQHLRHLNIARLLHEKHFRNDGIHDSRLPEPRGATATTTYVPLFPRAQSSHALVVTALGLAEPLATLFARSQEALMLGLSSKQFLISSVPRASGAVCRRCCGAGLITRNIPGFALPDAAPCPVCAGARFQAPVSSITFKGTTLWQLLNGTVREALPVLKALPKKGATLRLIEALNLLDIPLGLPTNLLSPDEHRLLLIAQGILRGTPSKPTCVIVEAASIGFCPHQLALLETLIRDDGGLLAHAGLLAIDR